ncbi:MAG: hypothetical protein M1827_005227 [Pycnora praestabilis]|nr:MAG: hypothetical protein M1827_005227 [Pycnora praestabilis]
MYPHPHTQSPPTSNWNTPSNGNDPGCSSTTLSDHPRKPPQQSKKPQRRLERLEFKEDYRGRLSIHISRFLGYRPPGSEPPYDPLPIPPFTWLHKLPLRYEVWIFAWVGAFITVLVFGVIESPLAQPRNLVLGHFVSALIGTAISRLFVLNASYQGYLTNTAFHGTTFVNGGLSMATALLSQLIIGAVHPPAGATGLNTAVEADVVQLSWRYLPTVVASSLIMLGWALIINNLGRRRYPIYWWLPQSMLVSSSVNEMGASEEEDLKDLEEGKLRQAEDGGRTSEGLLMERIEGEGGSNRDVEEAFAPGHRDDPEAVVMEPNAKNMDDGDRERAEGLDDDVNT